MKMISEMDMIRDRPSVGCSPSFPTMMIARSPSLGGSSAYQPPCKPGHANRGNGSRLLTRRNIRTHVAADDALLRSQAQQLENSLADSENSVLPDAAQLTLARRMVATLFGAEDNSLLADNFTFEGPVVGPLNKEQYCAAVSSFNLREAFPDYTVEAKDDALHCGRHLME